jgi:hypothetical protein
MAGLLAIVRQEADRVDRWNDGPDMAHRCRLSPTADGRHTCQRQLTAKAEVFPVRHIEDGSVEPYSLVCAPDDSRRRRYSCSIIQRKLLGFSPR